MNIKHYIKIARPDHWIKQIFVLPGIALAIIAVRPDWHNIILPIILGLFSTCLIASANYTINEWLDREFDKFHPKKKDRPSVNNLIRGPFVYLEYTILSIFGIIMGSFVSNEFVIILMVLLAMGIIYNVRPFRSKEKPFLDVLSESINNPIRLALGWFIITNQVLPPTTLLIAYWMGGAFLMAIKRYAEYISINDKETASLYRKSFIFYNRENLILSSLFYALCSVFFLGVFMYKYRLELIISFPFISFLFVWYMYFALSPSSKSENVEGLYTERKFILYLIFLVLLIGILLYIHIPDLQILTEHSFR